MRPRRHTMRRLNVFIAIVAALVIPAAGLIAAAPAMAYNVTAVYRDCETNGQLTGHYSRAELQAAVNSMPANMAEYSSCQAIIQHALLAGSGSSGHHSGTGSGAATGGGHGGGGSGTSASRASGGANGTGGSPSGGASAYGSSGRSYPVTLGGSNIRPGSTGSSAAARSLPAVLVVVLILLALTAASGGAVAIRRRVVTRDGT